MSQVLELLLSSMVKVPPPLLWVRLDWFWVAGATSRIQASCIIYIIYQQSRNRKGDSGLSTFLLLST
jgi:hypothetical protein